MTYPEATAIIGGAVIVVVGAVYTLVRLLGRRNGHTVPICPVNAGDGIGHLRELGREQVTLLRELKDALVVMGAQLERHADRQVVIGEKVQAVHSRLDAALVAMRRT